MKEAINQWSKNILAIHIAKTSYCIGPRGNIINQLMDGLVPLWENSSVWAIDSEKRGFSYSMSVPSGDYDWRLYASDYSYILPGSRKIEGAMGGWITISITPNEHGVTWIKIS